MRYVRWGALFAAVAAVVACTPFNKPQLPDGGDAPRVDSATESQGVGSSPMPDGAAGDSGAAPDASSTSRDADQAEVDSSAVDASTDTAVQLGPPGTLVLAKSIVLDGDIAALAALPDDTVLVAGTFKGTAHFGPVAVNTSGDEDVFLAAYSGIGDFKWVTQMGGPMDDSLGGIAVMADGNVAVVGSFSGSAVFGQGRAKQITLQSAGSDDIFLAVYRGSGDLDSARRAGGEGGEYVTAVGARPEGGLVLRGFWQSATLHSGFFYPGAGDFVTALGPDLSVAWNHTYSAGTESPGAVVGSVGGSTTLTSYTEFSVEFWPGNSRALSLPGGPPEYYTLVVDEAGVPRWLNRVEGAGSALSNQFVVDLPAGNVAVGGTFQGPTTFHNWPVGASSGNDETTISTTDDQEGVFIARYDAAGDLRATAELAAPSLRETGAVGIGDGSVVVSGTFEGAIDVAPSVVSAGGADVFVAVLGIDGKLRWAKRAGGKSIETCSSPALLSDGSIVVVGSFTNSATFGKSEAKETTLTAPSSGLGQFMARFSP